MDLKHQFHKALLDTCQRTKRETTYNPTGFFQMLTRQNGVIVAKSILRGKDQSGLSRLWEEGRLDLSMEALILDAHYKDLFTDEEREIARQRLIECNYTFPAEAEAEAEAEVADTEIELGDIEKLFVPGREVRRKDLHAMLGGQQQGGISTPAKFPIILAFTGDRGEDHGYKDGWSDEGIFLYTGEGQEGDMEFTKGNKAIRDHHENGEDIHLFEYRVAGSGIVYYVGQMSYIGHQIKDKDSKGRERKVIVFELMPSEDAVAETFNLEAMEHIRSLSLEDLRRKAIEGLQESARTSVKERKAVYRERSLAVKQYALKRANGVCEACGKPAPFINKSGEPFLEVHHLRKLSDGGPDHPDWVAAVCPNCHRRAHNGHDSTIYNDIIIKKIKDIGITRNG